VSTKEIYKPLPYRGVNKVLRKYTEDFIDPVGNKAKISYVDYMTPKGKLVERFTMQVKWEKYNCPIV